MKQALSKLNRGTSLSGVEMTSAMEAIVGGQAADAQIEEFLLLLNKKGETVEEITAAANVMRKYAVKLSKSFPDLLDTCGTGGDAKRTLNVSTLAAIVAAAAGTKVAKHGNRSVSSVCGSADLLELLGVRIDCSADEVEASIEKTGFGFFFAPRFHPAARFAAAARKKIKTKTLFNILGPLSNPAGACYQLIGVYEEKLVKTLAQALLQLGSRKAWVVHGEEGLDEISTCGKTKIAEVANGKIKTFTVSPKDLGLPAVCLSDLCCESKEACKAAALAVLEKGEGPGAQMVYANAGAALFIAGSVSSFKEGVELSKKTIESKAAYRKLQEIVSQ